MHIWQETIVDPLFSLYVEPHSQMHVCSVKSGSGRVYSLFLLMTEALCKFMTYLQSKE